MDFSFPPEAEAFRSEVRDFLATNLTEEMIEATHDGTMHIPALHRAMAERGWLSGPVPAAPPAPPAPPLPPVPPLVPSVPLGLEALPEAPDAPAPPLPAAPAAPPPPPVPPRPSAPTTRPVAPARGVADAGVEGVGRVQ